MAAAADGGPRRAAAEGPRRSGMLLEEHGIDTTIIRMPANFPPSGHATRELSGMGTPDLLGTYGTFSFYTSDPFADRRPGGRRHHRARRGARPRGARCARGPGQSAAEGAREGHGGVHRAHRRHAHVREDRRRRRGAAPARRRVERLGARAVQPGRRRRAARAVPLLPEAALDRTSSCTSARSTSIRWRRRCRSRRRARYAAESRARHRALLHAGHARGHQESQDRRSDDGRVPGAGAHRRRRSRAAVSRRCSTGSTTASCSTTSATSIRSRT